MSIYFSTFISKAGYTHELVHFNLSKRASVHASGSTRSDLVRKPSTMEMLMLRRPAALPPGEEDEPLTRVGAVL